MTRRTVFVYTESMKNITLSADEKLIEDVRKLAVRNGTTLNNMFRDWLRQQSAQDRITPERFRELMDRLSYVRAGRKFTREEMNER